MKYLLDTAVWLRGYFEPDTIPERQRKKHQLGSLPLDRDLEAWFHHAIAGNVDVLPLTPEIVAEAMRLPAFPTRDPADELIVATARMHRLVLVTTDRRLRGYRHAKMSYFRPAAVGTRRR